MPKPSDSKQDPLSYDDVSLEALGAHLFFGEVDEEKVEDACHFILKRNLFSSQKEPISLFINTPGGEASQGFALIDVMECSTTSIATIGLGQVSSMGVLVISAGTHGMRILTKNTEVMAHQFSGWFGGKHHELIATYESFGMLKRRMLQHFERHSTMSSKQIADILMGPTDRYLTPNECKKYGLIDRVVDSVSIPTVLKK